MSFSDRKLQNYTEPFPRHTRNIAKCACPHAGSDELNLSIFAGDQIRSYEHIKSSSFSVHLLAKYIPLRSVGVAILIVIFLRLNL